LCSCSARNEQQEIPPALNSKGEVRPEPAIAELARLAQAAQTEQERRSVCLRAIDEGRVYAGGPVSTLDQIFGTQFASELPTNETVAKRVILFAKQPEPPVESEHRAEAIGYVGSYLDADYDHEGKLRYYYISNLHKGMSSRVFAGESAPPIAELKRFWELADSESKRREIALRAIDEGVIQTFPPVNVSIVDNVFGSHLASTIATGGKQRTQTGIINFGSGSGWFMAVDYDRIGTITNYYLTNIRK
jgi:hypothetical protein